jgi:hypothetical protein
VEIPTPRLACMMPPRIKALDLPQVTYPRPSPGQHASPKLPTLDLPSTNTPFPSHLPCTSPNQPTLDRPTAGDLRRHPRPHQQLSQHSSL